MSLFLYLQNPAYQAVLFLTITPIVIFVCRPKSADNAWLIAAYAFIGFMIVNAIMLWFDQDPWRYFFYSLAVEVCYLLLVAIILSGVLKVLRLKGSGESAMAFLVMIYQPFALLFVMLVKWIASTWFA